VNDLFYVLEDFFGVCVRAHPPGVALEALEG
jgi:hypothetical protein